MSTSLEVRTARPYLQQPLPVALIFGAFFALTVPLSLANYGQLSAALSTMESIALSPVAQAYICCLGLTHFFLTFTIYFQSGNLRHFASSWRNRIIFFAIPIAIFLFFDLFHGLALDVRFVGFAAVVFIGIRFLDFLHFNRQNFGVHQLFKGKSGALFPKWMKRVEQCYFMTLVVLIFQTFLAADHRMPLDSPSFILTAAIAGGLLAAIFCGYALAVRSAPSRVLAAPFGYFLLQSAAAGLAVYSTALYVFSLAMHYIEYHVLMAPRCFNTRLDRTSRVDRWFDRLRRHKVVFYCLLLAAAASFFWVHQSGAATETSAVPYRLLVHIFDGLFVFHYFVEAFIWKFSDPYFRQTLGPLYFPSPAPVRVIAAATRSCS